MLFMPQLNHILQKHNFNFQDFPLHQQQQLQAIFSEMNENCRDFATERSQYLEDLTKLKAVIDTTPSTISWINNRLEYLGVNKAMEKMLNLPEYAYLGKKLGFNSTNDYFIRFAQELFASKEAILYRELTSSTKDGQEKFFWIVGSRYNFDQEAVIIGLDITEFKNLQEQLKYKEKLAVLGMLAAGMAHEIKNPLNVIKNTAYLLKIRSRNNKLTTADIIEHMKSLEKNVDMINVIVKGLQNFSRQSENDPFVKVNLLPIVNESLALCQDKLRRLDISVNFSNINPQLEVFCRPGEIIQVFVNLVNNSCDAIEQLEDRWIKIISTPGKESVKITVIDSGKGISSDIQDKLFDAFYTSKPLGKGTGLGLSICKGLVANHQGELGIDKTLPNTAFYFSLPTQCPPEISAIT